MDQPDRIATRRREQMFPTLMDEEIVRACRFGEPVTFPEGEPLVTAGVPARGLFLLRSGRVRVSRRDGLGGVVPIVEHGPGAFVAEVGTLSGRAALVDAHALEAVEAVVLAPERLRALMVAEAALGERIMRSLILRRTSLIETGEGGPLFIGPAASADIARGANGTWRVVAVPAGPYATPASLARPSTPGMAAAASRVCAAVMAAIRGASPPSWRARM